MKVLHIGHAGPIMTPFVDLINSNFDPADHLFLLYTTKDNSIAPESNVNTAASSLGCARSIPRIIINMHRSKKIILHGIFNPITLLMLATQPWILKKCYWVIWGGDLYSHETDKKTLKWRITTRLKKTIIPKMGNFITHIKGDYELAQQWFGAKGKWHECFMYPSNLFNEHDTLTEPHQGTNILLGNSATRTNQHMEAIEKLKPFAQKNIKIICPLSYGDKTYGDAVENAGRDAFGEKFIALRNFMPLNDYLKLLANIDVAIFNNSRQQGMGNLTAILGMGKKVYMKTSTSSHSFFLNIGVTTYDVENLDDALLTPPQDTTNIKLVKNYFSLESLLHQLNKIFQ